MRKPRKAKPSPSTIVEEKKSDGLSDFFGSLRNMRGDGSRLPTSSSIERAVTDGPLPERTDLRGDDVGAIVFLRSMGEMLGVDEYIREADIWMETFISKDRLGRAELIDALKAKIEKEYELARIEAKKEEAQAGRERRV